MVVVMIVIMVVVVVVIMVMVVIMIMVASMDMFVNMFMDMIMVVIMLVNVNVFMLLITSMNALVDNVITTATSGRRKCKDIAFHDILLKNNKANRKSEEAVEKHN